MSSASSSLQDHVSSLFYEISLINTSVKLVIARLAQVEERLDAQDRDMLHVVQVLYQNEEYLRDAVNELIDEIDAINVILHSSPSSCSSSSSLSAPAPMSDATPQPHSARDHRHRRTRTLVPRRPRQPHQLQPPPERRPMQPQQSQLQWQSQSQSRSLTLSQSQPQSPIALAAARTAMTPRTPSSPQ